MLRAIAIPAERLRVFEDGAWLSEGIYQIKEDSKVKLINGNRSCGNSADSATVKFKGNIPDLRPGIFFGIELQV